MTCRPTTITCRVTPRITIPVRAPQRVQPPPVELSARCVGTSSVIVSMACRRGLSARCVGASSVAASMAARRGLSAPISGGSSVTASMEVRHNMEHIKRIFGESDILLLVAGDGAGGVQSYHTAPGFVETSDNVEGNVIPPVTDSFSQNGVEVGVLPGGQSIVFSSPFVETFSMGMFVGKCTNDTGIIARVNNMYLYSSTGLNLMIRDAKAGISYFSGAGLAKYDEPDFWIMEADKTAQQMHMRGAGGKYTVNAYPEDMTLGEVRFGRITGYQIYDVQFYVLLNRLMTDDEIAQVRALL